MRPGVHFGGEAANVLRSEVRRGQLRAVGNQRCELRGGGRERARTTRRTIARSGALPVPGACMNRLVVAAAQCHSVRGDLRSNLTTHLSFVHAAAAAGVDLLVFPELSLTGYELDLAGGLQLDRDDPWLEPLSAAAAATGMHLLVGAPWRTAGNRPRLAAFLISGAAIHPYAKIHVHESEAPYFDSGAEHCVARIGATPIGLAICADSSHAGHPAALARQGAELYAVSVMKTGAEYPAHAARLARYAARHRMAVLCANYAGSSGGEASAGGSALWDDTGRIVVRAEANDAALVIGRRLDGRWSGEVRELR